MDTGYKSYLCLNCGLLYDEAVGRPKENIPPGTAWEDVPDDWICPQCGSEKIDFEIVLL